MRGLTLLACTLAFFFAKTQNQQDTKPRANIRLSCLIFPFTPLLTVELRTFGNLSIQLESNFVNTHGANLKYFVKHPMNGHFVFAGMALLENKRLRKDGH